MDPVIRRGDSKGNVVKKPPSSIENLSKEELRFSA